MRQQVYEMARRSILQTLRQPALVIPPIVFPLLMMAINTGGLDAATDLPGFPADTYLDFAIAVPFMQCALFAVHQCRRGARARRRDRVPQAPGDDADAARRADDRPPRRRDAGRARLGADLPRRRLRRRHGLRGGAARRAGAAGAGAAGRRSRSPALGAFVGLRSGSGETVQGFFPLFFVLLFLSSMSLPRPLIEQDWFRFIATYNPVSYMIEGVRVVHHHRLGRRGPRARVRHRDHRRGGRDRGRVERPADAAGADMRRFWQVARAVAWRSIHKIATTPGAAAPVGGLPAVLLRRVRRRPVERRQRAGLRRRVPVRLHGVPVRVRAAAGVGLRGRVHRLRDRVRLRERVRAAAAAGGAEPVRDHRRLRDRGAPRGRRSSGR